MSDHVSYFVGDTIHRDHGNWPTILGSAIADGPAKDETWPVDVTLDQWMALCWRIRKWVLTGGCSVSKTIHYTAEGQSPVTAIGTATLVPADIWLLKGTGGSDARCTREADIVGVVGGEDVGPLVNGGFGAETGHAPISNWTQLRDGTVPYSGSTPPATVSIPFDTALNMDILGTALYDPSTKLFSPPFSGLGSVINGFSVPLNVHVGCTRDRTTALSGVAPFSCHFPIDLTVIAHIVPTFTVPMQLAWRFVGEPPSSAGIITSGLGSGAFTLEATEFWPHKNRRGEQVYGVNGSQINDPFGA